MKRQPPPLSLRSPSRCRTDHRVDPSHRACGRTRLSFLQPRPRAQPRRPSHDPCRSTRRSGSRRRLDRDEDVDTSEAEVNPARHELDDSAAAYAATVPFTHTMAAAAQVPQVKIAEHRRDRRGPCRPPWPRWSGRPWTSPLPMRSTRSTTAPESVERRPPADDQHRYRQPFSRRRGTGRS